LIMSEPLMCVMCKKEIEGNPWISVQCDQDCIVHGCSYICSKTMDQVVGDKFWDKVINKDDFFQLYPKLHKQTETIDITHNFQKDEILREIQEEEEWMRQMEMEDEETSSDSDDWENYG